MLLLISESGSWKLFFFLVLKNPVAPILVAFIVNIEGTVLNIYLQITHNTRLIVDSKEQPASQQLHVVSAQHDQQHNDRHSMC